VIDPRLLREDPERVRRSQRTRGADESAVDAALAADTARREAIGRAEALRAEQKSLGKGVASAQGDERDALLAKLGDLAAQVKQAEAEETLNQDLYDGWMRRIDNVVEDDVPPGGEDDYVVLREVGTRRDFDFPVRDHVEIGEALGAIDTERGAKVSGARFYYLTGVGALLELALVNFAMAKATAAGLVPVITPALVKPEAMEGTGFLGAHAAEVYKLENDDLYLVGTSEVALAGMHMNEILDLPDGERRRYAGFSSCFRREAGSYGKDTRGIIRVHWFDKVEMFTYAPPDRSADEHQRLLAIEEDMLSALELPYRVIDVAGGDLGSSAARKFDCEAWLPSQERWLELTSTSNCTGFQARRLNIRYRDRAAAKPATVHTLNGTLMASTRSIVAILENHQQADGSVVVPAALRPYLGGRETL
jgi:seryl-tRNA synthetase